MKTAVILFNLGGPDNLQNVKPFLFNLFNDKAIIAVPQPMRYFLAKLISGKREEKAKGIYSQIGGSSPIVELTNKQAQALEQQLGEGYKVFTCMRYWHPMSEEVAKQVKDYAPDEIIFLPLYPQYSTTTTASSFQAFRKALGEHNFKITEIVSYETEEDFINAHVELLRPHTEAHPDARVLFSAHGLPQKVIDAGDPYQKQVEATSKTVAEKLNLKDWLVCYQSKVGPLKWLTPNTEDEIIRAGETKTKVILTPIAFVSEHSETLVELDIQFREEAEQCGVPEYIRIPALGTHPLFIKSLANLVRNKKGS